MHVVSQIDVNDVALAVIGATVIYNYVHAISHNDVDDVELALVGATAVYNYLHAISQIDVEIALGDIRHESLFQPGVQAHTENELSLSPDMRVNGCLNWQFSTLHSLGIVFIFFSLF